MAMDTRLTDIGTTEEHLGHLLNRWRLGLESLNRAMLAEDVSKETKEKQAIMVGSIALLFEYMGKHPASTRCTRYDHLAAVYEEWTESLSIAERGKSRACKEVAAHLKGATTLLYNFLSEDTSNWTLTKLVNDATSDGQSDESLNLY